MARFMDICAHRKAMSEAGLAPASALRRCWKALPRSSGRCWTFAVKANASLSTAIRGSSAPRAIDGVRPV
eukprot:6200699-Pleurochrysis_carterae.AAC.2